MYKKALVIFVKNIKLGKVKTRLAKTVGNQAAFEVYKFLLYKLQLETANLNCDKIIYFSDAIIEEKWPGCKKYVQQGENLGERMHHAIKQTLNSGYSKVILIGSDIPDLSSAIIQQAFDELENKTCVLGPALDGGYYLIGLKKAMASLFINKTYSHNSVMKEVIHELNILNESFALLPQLMDIDTFEDLQQYPEILKIISKNDTSSN